MRLSYRIAPLLLLATAACSSGRELLVVTVTGSRSGLSSIRVALALDGKNAQNVEQFAADVRDFGLELPAGASGDLTILVGGIDGRGCIVEDGVVEMRASDTDRVNLTVPLIPLVPPQCPGG